MIKLSQLQQAHNKALYSDQTTRGKLVVCCANFTTSLLCSAGPVSKALSENRRLMGFLKRILGRKEPARSEIEIRGAGRLLWNAGEQYWIGSYKGVRLSVAYEGLSEPSADFSDFIDRSLSRPALLEEIVISAKEEAAARYPKELHHEIDRFAAKEIVFQGPNFILFQFFGPHDHEPFWFCELHGNKIYVGRDT